MITQSFARKASGVPILSRAQIDQIGEEVIRNYNPYLLERPQEVDIDDLIQNHLRLHQEYHYLSHNGSILGMMVFYDSNGIIVFNPDLNEAEYVSIFANTIVVDNSLLDEYQEARYRFTVAHEASHNLLHREYFEELYKQKTTENTSEFTQCRIDTMTEMTGARYWVDNDWMEWQANCLASAILMPKSMVTRAISELDNKDIPKEERAKYERRMISQIFNVSWEAAEYRLSKLELLSPTIKAEDLPKTVPPAKRKRVAYSLTDEDHLFIRKHEARLLRAAGIE